MRTTTPPERSGDDPVPIFGTWPRIYAAVVLTLGAVLLLIALFSRWPY